MTIKKLTKQISILFISILIAFNPVVLPVAYAIDESTPSATLITGNASSVSTTQTEANTNQDEVLGNITPGSCGPEVAISCPGPGIINENSADTQNNNESSAQTGKNTSTDAPGDVRLNTGEATASGNIETQVNTNLVLVATDSGNLNPNTETFLISNANEARIENNMQVDAGTGQNSASDNLGSVAIYTGDAKAIGNVFSAQNLNFLGSDFQMLVIDILSQEGNLDLNQVWLKLLGQQPQNQLSLAPQSSSDYLTLALNNNEASVSNKLNVAALTGENLAEENSGNVGIYTGNAKAVGNIVSVTNANFTGSKILFVVVNILDSLKGDIILPRPERFSLNSEGIASANLLRSHDQSEIENRVSADSSSGENVEDNYGGNNNTETGLAKSTANSTTITNLDFEEQNQYFLTYNNLGQQDGYICGWADPEVCQQAEEGNRIFTTGGYNASSSVSLTDEKVRIKNLNKAKIKNDLHVYAKSGGNSTLNNGGSSNIITGSAIALANLFDLSNINIFGSNLFFGLINNLGDWQGNQSYGYPDVSVSIDGPLDSVLPGQEAVYTLSYKNEGNDLAEGVQIGMDLPKGTEFLADTSEIQTQISGNRIQWLVNNLAAGERSSFQVRLMVKPELKPDDLTSFFERLIKTAYAAEGTGIVKNIVVNVSITNSIPESNSQNDRASYTTKVLFPDKNQDQGTTQGVTTLEVTAYNDAKDGIVYRGDIINFNIQVENSGPVKAKNVTLSQKMYDGGPLDTGSIDFDLGDIEPGKTVDIEFGLELTEEIAPDIYYGKVTATGENASSNEAVTQFEVKLRKNLPIINVPEVKAAENNKENPQVLGTSQFCPAILAKKEWWPYALAILLGTLWAVEFIRRKQGERALNHHINTNNISKIIKK